MLLHDCLPAPQRSQTRICHSKEQSHGPLSPRHDDAICCPYADRSLLLLWLPICIVDVSSSTPCLERPNRSGEQLKSQRRWVCFMIPVPLMIINVLFPGTPQGFSHVSFRTMSFNTPSFSTIAWWMLDIWFGLDAIGFNRAGRSFTSIYFQLFIRAGEFDPVIGPILMITYACLSNTLLLTGTWSFYCNFFKGLIHQRSTRLCKFIQQ